MQLGFILLVLVATVRNTVTGEFVEPRLPAQYEWSARSLKDFTVSLPTLQRVISSEYAYNNYIKLEFLPTYGHQLSNTSKEIIANYTRRYEIEAIDGVKVWMRHRIENLTLYAITEHPILILRMFRRLYRDFFKVHEIVMQATNEKMLYEKHFPSKNDTETYSITLLVALYFHNLDVYKFAQGKFGPIDTGISLTPMQALHLASVAKSIQFMATAVTLSAFGLEQALQNGQVTKKEMDEVLQEVVEEHDRVLFSNPKGFRDLFTEKIGEAKTFLKKRGQFATQRRKLSFDKPQVLTNHPDALLINYLRVCSGEDLQGLSHEERAKLSCWLNPVFPPLHPMKWEQLSEDPTVFKIHDFFDSKLCSAFIKRAHSRLKLSKDAPRLSMTAELIPDEFLQGHAYNRMVGMGAEELLTHPAKVYSMIPGGHYGPISPKEPKTPGRGTATIVVHLNDVMAGGRTALPGVGISDAPRAGTALLWYSHFENGEVDSRTSYGSCPVLLGTKWVVTMSFSYELRGEASDSDAHRSQPRRSGPRDNSSSRAFVELRTTLL